jgi:hypothetical protein
MFDTITKKSHNYLQLQIDELKQSCDKDPGVAEMVRYILAYSDQMAYCGGDEDARIGRQIIQHIWQISGIDLSNMGNSSHFSPDWARQLNHFIGNWVYDDSGFDFEVCDFNGTIDFKSADYSGRWLQNPMVIVEAAKANRAYYKMMDNTDVFTRLRGTKADISKVMELVK